MKKKKKIEQKEPEKWDFRDKMIDGYSPYPSLGAYEYVRSLENIENETEKHHFNEKLEFMKKNEEKQEKKYIENGYAYVLQKQRNDGYLYDSGVCLSKSLAYEMRENEECDYVEEVPIFGSEQDKELLDKLKNQPQFEPFNSDLFTDKIAETANKTAQVSHDLEMKRIKAKLISDLCKELVKTPISYTDVPQIAREIADKALQNL